MIKDHEIYMGGIILKAIKDELGEGEFIWYKENMTELVNGTYKETAYYLTSRYLIETKTSAENLIIQKFDRNTIERVEKEFKIKQNNIILEKATIFFKDDSLFFKRPNQNDNGDTKGFERFFKQF